MYVENSNIYWFINWGLLLVMIRTTNLIPDFYSLDFNKLMWVYCRYFISSNNTKKISLIKKDETTYSLWMRNDNYDSWKNQYVNCTHDIHLETVLYRGILHDGFATYFLTYMLCLLLAPFTFKLLKRLLMRIIK